MLQSVAQLKTICISRKELFFIFSHCGPNTTSNTPSYYYEEQLDPDAKQQKMGYGCLLNNSKKAS